MKKIILMLCMLFSLVLAGCSSTTPVFNNIGDGKIDAVEAASLNLVIGLYMDKNNSVIKPAYYISSILIDLIDNKTIISADEIDSFIIKEANKTKIDKETLNMINDLVVLIKAKVSSDLQSMNLSSNDKLVLVVEILKIIQTASEARI